MILFLIGVAAMIVWGLLYLFAHIAEQRQGLCTKCHNLRAASGTGGLCLECYRVEYAARRELDVTLDDNDRRFEDFINSAVKTEVNEEPAITRKKRAMGDGNGDLYEKQCPTCEGEGFIHVDAATALKMDQGPQLSCQKCGCDFLGKSRFQFDGKQYCSACYDKVISEPVRKCWDCERTMTVQEISFRHPQGELCAQCFGKMQQAAKPSC